jgi:outer membrane protein TolC
MRYIFIVIVSVVITHAAELSLTDAQKSMDSDNYDVKINREDVRRAKEVINESRSSFFPSLDFYGNYNYITEKKSIKMPDMYLPNGRSFQIDPGQNSKTEFSLDLVYPVFTGFSRNNMLYSKKLNYESKEQSLHLIQNQSAYSLGLFYFRWIVTSKSLDVKKKSIEQMDIYTKQMKTLYDGGVVVLAKVLDAEAKHRAAQLDYLLNRDQADSLKRQICELTRLNDSSWVPVSENLMIDSVAIPLIIDECRPEIQIYNKAIEQVEINKRLIAAQQLPSVTAITGYRIANPGLVMNGKEFMDYFIFGAQVKVNIFDGFKKRSQKSQLQYQLKMTTLERDKNIDKWSRALNSWKIEIANADERIRVAETAQKAAEELVSNLESSLNAGVVTDVDYLAAVTSLVQTSFIIEQARMNRRIAVLNALFVSGKKIHF